MLILKLLMSLKISSLHLFKSLLFVDELLGGLVELVDVVAEVLGSCQLEKVRVERGHVGLNVVEQECLNQVATVHTNGYLLEQFTYSQVLGSDLILNEIDFI